LEAGASEVTKERRSLLAWLRRLVYFAAPHGLMVRWINFRQPDVVREADTQPEPEPSEHELRLRTLAALPPVRWSASDVLLAADSAWNQPGLLAAVKGGPASPQVLGFVYDMIHLDRLDFVNEQAQRQFLAWATELAAHSKEIVCISRHAAEGMQRFVRSLPLPEGVPRVRPIRFGNRVEAPLGDVNGASPVELPAALRGDEGWMLWLGSVDRRKNLDVVLLALEGLYASGKFHRRFVVAGRPALGSAELLHRIRFNPILHNRVVFIDSPSDRLVGRLLDGASLMVFSSWAEGYGLPVAEALQHGVPVLASRATSIPEVAGDLVDYFDPWDTRGLAELLEKFEADAAYRMDLQARAKKFVPTSWDETLEDILHAAD
jgi:glycosyltransferase involved in cell wall biosynthesis